MTWDQTFVHQLVDTFPQLQPIFSEHLEYFDELLPRVFLADVARYVTAGFGAQADAQHILDWFETRYAAGDDDIEEVIATGFLENLPRPFEGPSPLLDALGPSLAAQMKRLG